MSEVIRYAVGQRVLIKTARFGVKEAIIRSFRWSDDGDDLVVVDLDPGNGPVGMWLGHVYDERQIIGPVARKGAD